MLSGSSVQNGQGKYMIIAVGENSENGRIQALVRGNKLKLGGGDAEAAGSGSGSGSEGGGRDLEAGRGGAGSSGDPAAAVKPGDKPAAAAKGDDSEGEETASLLTAKLDDTATLIGKLAVAVACLAFVAMILNYTIKHFAIQEESWNGDVMRHEIIEWIITAVTIVVVAVPEGKFLDSSHEICPCF